MMCIKDDPLCSMKMQFHTAYFVIFQYNYKEKKRKQMIEPKKGGIFNLLYVSTIGKCMLEVIVPLDNFLW